MHVVLSLIPFAIVLVLAAALLRLSGRILAKATISWPISLKYMGIFVLLGFANKLIALSLGPTGTWIAVPIAIAVPPLLGAFYLGPRVVKDSGFDLGPITGAVVATGAAAVGLLIVIGMLVVVRIIVVLVQ